MKSYWNLTKQEKKEAIENGKDNSYRFHSYSNNVFKVLDVIVKERNLQPERKRNIESMILGELGIKNEIIEDYLVVTWQEGEKSNNHSLTKGSVEDISNEIDKFRKIKFESDKPLEKMNLPTFIHRKKEYILKNLWSNFGYNLDFDKFLLDISELRENVICHLDLSQNNILFNELRNKTIIIDYEEAKLSNSYIDFSILILNWRIDSKIIDWICNKYNFKKELLLNLSIIWGIIIIQWNDNILGSSSEKSFVDRNEFIKKRIKEIIILL